MSFGERFLELPDLFPARQSGEPWGDERVALRLAGSDFVCDGLSPTQARGIRARFGKLSAGAAVSADAPVEIRVFRASAHEFIRDETDWEFDFDLAYPPGAVMLAGFRFMGRLDWGPPLSVALWTSEDERLVSHGIFENTLRVVVAYNLLERGGLLLHSAAAATDTGAHVLFGPSGAGKSTASRLLLNAGHAVLSDDMNALHLTTEGVFVERVPFTGDLGPTIDSVDRPHRVRNLCRLAKGGAPELRSMRPASAVAALLECTPFVNRNPHRHDQLIERLEALHFHAPVRTLTFAIDDRFLRLLEAPGPR